MASLVVVELPPLGHEVVRPPSNRPYGCSIAPSISSIFFSCCYSFFNAFFYFLSFFIFYYFNFIIFFLKKNLKFFIFSFLIF
jgi:hypothetical protein